MEFFKTVEKTTINKEQLKELSSIEALPKLCQSIDSIISDKKSSGTMYCIWGEFEINREILKYGIRFSLPNCPNALAWSITLNEMDSSIVIHCTINKTTQDELFT